MALPVLSRRRKLDKDALVKRAIAVACDPKILKAEERREVEPVVKALQYGAGQGQRSGKPVSAAVLAQRAHQALGPSSGLTPPDIAAALVEQGLDWVQPFPPGQPLVPYYGYGRRPRQLPYPVGYNITTETRPSRIPFTTLYELWKSYDVAQACTRYSIQDLRSMRIRFEAMDGYKENPVEQITEAKRFLRHPDGFNTTRNFIAANQRNLWIFDSAPIFRLKNKGGRLKQLKNVTPRTIAPALDYYGDIPDGDAPAYQQFITGVPWDWLKRENIIYQPFWPQTDSPYGTPPLETVLVNANCYSADTEVLTRGGWKNFADVDIDTDEFATRNPVTGELEWQWASKHHRAPGDGVMFHAKSKNVDLLVTGGHRLLVDRVPKGCPGVKHGDMWLVHAEDLYRYQQALPSGGRAVFAPATSAWNAPDLLWFPLPYADCETVRFEPSVLRGARAGRSFNSLGQLGAVSRATLAAAERGSVVRRSSAMAICRLYGLAASAVIEAPRFFSGGMPGDDFAAFMGMWLSEGSVRSTSSNIYIAQCEKSKGFGEYRAALQRLLGRPPRHDGRGFTFGHTALADYLRQFGHADEKFIPQAILDMSRRQLEIFWHFYVLGDGHYHPAGHVAVTTVSRRMADGLQEVVQKLGMSAAVHRAGSPKSARHHQRWVLNTRAKERYSIRLEKVPYSGDVFCVSVPNKTLYVRRNGVPAWCANTDIRLQMFFLQFFTAGAVPEMFAIAPEDMTSPDDLADLQEQWTSEFTGTQARLHGLKFLPHGTELQPYKPQQFDPDLAEYVMRRTIAAFGLVPQNLGLLDDVNRSCHSADTQTLTENGWKHYWEVRPGEKIATFNPSTRGVEYHVPVKLFVYPYEGEMIHFRGRQVDALVTPDHKMWAGRRSEEAAARSTVTMWGLTEALQRRQGGHRNASGWSVSEVCRRLNIDRGSWLKAARGEPVRPATAEAIRSLLPEVGCTGTIPDRPTWYATEAQNLEGGGDFWFADPGPWDGGVEVDQFILPAVEAQSWRRPDRPVSMDAWVEFLGYIVSEGCIFGSGDGHYPVSLSQNERANPDKVRVIQGCIDRLPVRFNRYTDSGGTVRWQVSDKPLWMWLRENIGRYSGEKRLPPMWRTLGKRQLSILLDALILGDGSTNPSGVSYTYFTKSSALADDVQELAVRLGLRALRTTRRSGGVFRVHISAPKGLGKGLRWGRNARRETYRGNVWCFDVPPHHLFLTRRNGKVLVAANSATTQMDQQFRISTLPIVGYYEDLFNSILQETLTLPVQIRFDTGREKEDRLMEARAHFIYWQMGAESSTEVREKILGYPINPEEKIPRTVMDQRLGIIPMAHILAVSGDVDPLTGAPVPGSVAPVPYELPGGGTPVPAAGPTGGSQTAADADPKGTPTKVYPKPLLAASKEATDGPDEDSEYVGYGLWDIPHGSSGQGTGATHPPVALEEYAELRKWRAQSRRRVAGGKPPRRFDTSLIQADRYERVWKCLQGATTRKAVDAAFAKGTSPKAAGVVVQAHDTGRVLMVQRKPDKHDPGEAFSRWEFPGGKLTGDDPWTGGVREWSEETGATLPEGFGHLGNWTSPDGVYVGYVVEVPSERSLALAPQREEVSDARWWGPDELDDPEVRDKVTESLTRVLPLLKAWTTQPRGRRGRWRTPHQVRLEQFHRHTDRLVAHYAPEIQREMARLTMVAVLSVMHRAMRVQKATTKRPTQAAIVAGASAGIGAAVAGGGAVAVGGAGVGAAAILAQLESVALTASSAGLVAVLSALYADAYMQAVKEATQATGGAPPPWTTGVAAPDDGTWEAQGAVASAVQSLAGTGLSKLLAEAGVVVKGVDHTQLERIASAIATGIEDGFPVAQVEQEIREIIDTPTRAHLIAETEYARAMAAGQMDVYRRNGVPELQWLIEPGACPKCVANHEASPQPTMSPRWPSGPIPVHPHTRCVVAPYYGSLGG